MTKIKHQTIQLKTKVKRYLADTVTPVTLYLKFRDQFRDPVLLESNDFRSKEDCFSFIGLDSIASFEVQKGKITVKYPGVNKEETEVITPQDVPNAMAQFISQFEVSYDTNYKGHNGLFGHTGFDGVQYFDTHQFDSEKRKMDIPDIKYCAYRYVIAFNHFKDELYVLENLLPGQESEMDRLTILMESPQFATYGFKLVGEEQSNLEDEEFKDLVTKGKYHCQIGDVFQIVF